ncbi:4-alpha-glucanotransferase [Frisingicoccus sp.]|uniref:4-alpha-glucanotransferase n=1 Tax=Frisingicoccus sp. TaxID=1918627 RepID=UPI0025C608F3|nr:4-alpha-glucanotransferase [Frisingicoccus sp.]MDY5957155.1 4-alpha-glucanotransferase [Frisingicoccus sp.]
MKQKNYRPDRQSGILVHPTSLPGPYGIGDLGKTAYEFIDFLKTSGQTLWQCLPLGPTGFSNSPYQSYSAFAGQPLLISPELLIELNLLDPHDLDGMPYWSPYTIDFPKIVDFKTRLFKIAYEKFQKSSDVSLQDMYHEFCEKSEFWLTDYVLFMSLKDYHNGQNWTEWEPEYKYLSDENRKNVLEKLSSSVDYYRFIQFLFFKQWYELKNYANANGIEIIGDIPIFVSADSADVWANKNLFQLDEDGYPTVVAGVPPDYFSATGQLWGNPLYAWDEHKKEDYTWWIQRIRHQLTMTDIFRIDHFRGFEAYWATPNGEPTALNGHWVKGPGYDFFDHIMEAFDNNLPIIAEDLGIITPEVEELRDAYDLPGMRVLQFAFDDLNDNTHMPYNYVKNCVCYTGTHDNNTTRGWYRSASPESQDKARRYLSCNGENIHWDFIRLALSSTARYVIFPLQDVFGMDSDARMNVPGVSVGNWSWRFEKHFLNEGTADYLKQLSKLYGRNQKPTVSETVSEEVELS